MITECPHCESRVDCEDRGSVELDLEHTGMPTQIVLLECKVCKNALLGISEIVVLPTSRLIGTRIRDSRLRQDYSVTVLGIRRDKNYIKEELSDHRLQNGDTLLVQGK